MNDVQVKYEKLNPFDKKRVDSLIDLLLSKRSEKKLFDIAAYQKKIQDIPAWSEDDIKDLEENIKQFKNWNIEEW